MKLALASSVFAAVLVAGPAFSQEPPSDIPPNPKTRVTVDTQVKDKEDATVKTITKEFTPVSGRPGTQIAPEVMEVVNRGKRYTTKDLVNAQLQAMLNTPATKPSTTVTTTITSPRDPG